MLESILPGLRHLRAPLTAGYIWIVALWLFFRSSIAGERQLPERVRTAIGELADWAGKPASLAAVTLMAYLIGILSIATAKGIGRATRLLYFPPFKWIVPRYWLEKRVGHALAEAVDMLITERYIEDQNFRDTLIHHLSTIRSYAHNKGLWQNPIVERLQTVPNLAEVALQDEKLRLRLINTLVKRDEYVSSAKADISHLAYRLLGKEEQVYAEYDRQRSEATFRLAVVPPIAFLCITLAYTESSWWIVGLIAPVAFSYLAARSFGDAEQGLAAAVSAGRVELPSLERIKTREIALYAHTNFVQVGPFIES